MKLFFKLLSAALLSPLFTLAQSNYKPAYVVTIKGDTLKGEINQKEWFGNPRTIEFKNSAGVKNYTVDDIRFFELLNSVSYQRYAGPISIDETNTAKLSNGKDSTIKQDIVFLKIEQKGANVTLYSYVDAIKTRFYITENNPDNITELVYRIYFLPDHGVQTRSENIFIPQLYDMATKYNPSSERLKREIESATYSSTDLKSISQKINNMVADKKNYGGKASWKLFAGVGINSTSFKHSGTFSFFNVQDHTSVFPTLSLGVNVTPNPNVGKLVVRGEIQVTGATFKSIVDRYFNDPAYKAEYKINQFIIILNPQVIYTIYNTNAFKFYVDGGLAINIAKDSGNSLYNPKLDKTDENYLYLSKNWFNFPIKLGIVLNKKIDIWASYTTPASITDNSKYSIDATSIKAGINYQF
jgi:hypothetical protein